MVYVVFTGESNKSGAYIEKFVGVYTSRSSAKRAANRVDGFVRAVAFHNGSK